MNDIVVSNNGKRENCKVHTGYLFVDPMMKVVMGWETSLGCKCNRAKLWEEHEVIGNDVWLVREKKELE